MFFHAIVRTAQRGRKSYFHFGALPGPLPATPGWKSIRIPSLDWEVDIPDALYGVDPRDPL
eukprot:5417519-Heterocapsa_arctica.AAC.1